MVESFVAAWVGTSERFLTSMNAEMRLQIEIKTELFKANFALVGLFSCMHKHVSLQLSIVEKPLIACLKRALKLNFIEQVQLSTYQLVAMHSHVLF